jgi:thioredoxin reductase
MPRFVRDWLEGLLSSGSRDAPRPVLKRGNESNVRGLHVIGDLAGAPVIKLAMTQGVEVIEHLDGQPDMRQRGATGPDGLVDVLVVGAGAAGLNAALAAQEKGFSFVVLEKGRIANTIENFPQGKWVYAEPDAVPPKGKLWLDGATKEDLVERWNAIVAENDLDVRCEESLVALEKQPAGTFLATTDKGEHRARRVVLATGQRGNPRRLGVPGEDMEQVYHRLYSPRGYRDEDVLVVGGGNSAVEAAITLSEQNRVTLSYRRGAFSRLFKDNRRQLDERVAAGKVTLVLDSEVTAFRDGQTELQVRRDGAVETRVVKTEHAFVLIGAELPVRFLRSLGIHLENEWTGSSLRAALLTVLLLVGLWFVGPVRGAAMPFDLQVSHVLAAAVGGGLAALATALLVWTGWRGDRWSWLGLSFVAWYSIYGIKVGRGQEFWPYAGWGYDTISFFDRPWAFWYTVLYTALMTIFGLRALKRWGLDRRDRFQIWRFTSLLGFQWIFFFIVPEFLFQWAVEYQWVGAALAENPQFADQAWRSYGIVYAWPLFFYTWFYDPHIIWVVWGVLLTFVLIPLLVLLHGKRYCSWICGCGGLAETLGDQWRHLAPKGPAHRGLGHLRLPHLHRRLARWDPAGHRVPVHGREGVVPLLVPARQAHAGAVEAVREARDLAVPHRRQRQVHRLQRVLAQLPGRHRRDAVRPQAGDAGQRHQLLHRLRHLRDGLSHGHPLLQHHGRREPAGAARREHRRPRILTGRYPVRRDRADPAQAGGPEVRPSRQRLLPGAAREVPDAPPARRPSRRVPRPRPAPRPGRPGRAAPARRRRRLRADEQRRRRPADRAVARPCGRALRSQRQRRIGTARGLRRTAAVDRLRCAVVRSVRRAGSPDRAAGAVGVASRSGVPDDHDQRRQAALRLHRRDRRRMGPPVRPRPRPRRRRRQPLQDHPGARAALAGRRGPVPSRGRAQRVAHPRGHRAALTGQPITALPAAA